MLFSFCAHPPHDIHLSFALSPSSLSGKPAFLPTGSSGLAESDDGLTWTRVKGPLRGGAVMHPADEANAYDEIQLGVTDIVRKEGGGYVMHYLGGSAGEACDATLAVFCCEPQLPGDCCAESSIKARPFGGKAHTLPRGRGTISRGQDATRITHGQYGQLATRITHARMQWTTRHTHYSRTHAPPNATRQRSCN